MRRSQPSPVPTTAEANAGESGPRRSVRRRLRRWAARGLLLLTGWRPDGARPEPRRCVLIAAPHTTNWDFPYLLLFAAWFDLEIRWMGKHDLFRPPLGWLMRALGGIPIVRHRSENVVAAMARVFEEHDDMVLVVPAEGTRSRAEYWRSGFYHIATTARVPIVLSYLDYATRRGGFGPAFVPTGDVGGDMDRVRAFYAGRAGKHPERFGRVRLREEDAAVRAGSDSVLAPRVGPGSDSVLAPRVGPGSDSVLAPAIGLESTAGSTEGE